MSKFSGSYVNDIVKVLIASAVSGENAILIGAPGWGKTAISRQVAEAMTNGRYSFTRVDPSTPPEAIKGAYNPAAILDGRLERVVEGTPYASDCQIAIIDELFRGSDVLFDAALDTLDRQDTDYGPPVWSTANFVAAGTRVEALIDRIGLWLWIKPAVVDVAAVAAAHLTNGAKPSLDHDLPDEETIERIRQATAGPKAEKAVIEALQLLAEEAAKEGRHVHPRRVAQWAKILFSYAMYLTGSDNFDTLPKEAVSILRHAWPATSAAESTSWANIAGAAVDPVATVIDEALAEAFAEFKRVSQIGNVAERAAESQKLGQVSVKAQNLLAALSVDDPRIDEAANQINKWFADAVRGKAIER